MTPRICLADTEVAPNIGCFWGIHDQTVRYTDIIQEWFFISFQWKFLGDRGVSCVSVMDDIKRFKRNHADDYHVVKTAYDVISQCDILVGHNLKGYDWKRLQAKFIEHRLPPIKIPQLVDTLEWSKKYGFTSRKLGDLCKKLGLQAKASHDPGIFMGSAQGDTASIKKVVKYGVQDIPTLEELYLTLRPYAPKHPNFNAYRERDQKAGCPKCGSTHYHKRGVQCGRQTYACYDCRARFTGEVVEKKRVLFK